MHRIFSRSLFLAVVMLALSAASFAQIGVSVSFGPPELPVYDQPICPGDGYIWTPGYWAWDGYDYYWVPGTWILAPQPGFLWTPAWWGWGGGGFIFHEGYWGPHVGFYGGVNYGFGYFGHGFEGGRWDGGHFFYNRAVTNVNVTVIHNVYETKIVNNYGNSRVSYNGGRGGIEARASAEEEAAARDRHIAPVAAQVQHVNAARANPEFRANTNHGKPPVAASARPGEFAGEGKVAASEGHGYTAPKPENFSGNPGNAVHPKELPPNSRLSSPNTGNSNQDKKYQQQQQKLYAQQDKERQQLQQKQEQQHQQYTKQNASQQRTQQLEQQHQQQTQQLAQRHYQQQQQLQQHQQPKQSSPKEKR